MDKYFLYKTDLIHADEIGNPCELKSLNLIKSCCFEDKALNNNYFCTDQENIPGDNINDHDSFCKLEFFKCNASSWIDSFSDEIFKPSS
jgi:hypothetical protein